MLRFAAAVFLFAGILGLMGCDSGGGYSGPDNTVPFGVSTPAQVTIQNTANVRSITIYHELGNSGSEESVFNQNFFTQTPPDPYEITLNVIGGDNYRVDAVVLASDGTQHTVYQNFVGGSNSDNINFRSAGRHSLVQHLVFSVLQMRPLK